MYDVQFKVIKKHQLSNDISLLTDSFLGKSYLDESPIYNIKFNSNKELIHKLLFESTNKTIHINNIEMFLRKEKTKKILSKKKDKGDDKFTTFLQYYLDNIEYIIVLQQPSYYND